MIENSKIEHELERIANSLERLVKIFEPEKNIFLNHVEPLEGEDLHVEQINKWIGELNKDE